MKSNPLKGGAMTENGVGIGNVTKDMVQDRSVQLAAINGRSAQNPSQADMNQAKRELTGETDADPNDELLEAAPESERWDPLPGYTGHKVPNLPAKTRATTDAAIAQGSSKRGAGGRARSNAPGEQSAAARR
jgi:hypothetical protein